MKANTMIKRDAEGKVVEFEDEAFSARKDQTQEVGQGEGPKDTKDDLVFASEDDIDRAFGSELAVAKVTLENTIKTRMKPLTDKVAQINQKWEQAKGASRARKEIKIKEAEAALKLAIEVATECSKTEIAQAREDWYKEMTPVNQEAEALKAALQKAFEDEIASCKQRRSQRQIVLMEAKRLEAETVSSIEEAKKEDVVEDVTKPAETKSEETKPAESKPEETKPEQSKSKASKPSKSKKATPKKTEGQPG